MKYSGVVQSSAGRERNARRLNEVCGYVMRAAEFIEKDVCILNFFNDYYSLIADCLLLGTNIFLSNNILHFLETNDGIFCQSESLKSEQPFPQKHNV